MMERIEMIVTLKNERFELDVNTRGAEINRFIRRETGHDIIWRGDSSVWKFHAPILFPHCGKIKDAFVLIDGKSFPLKSNGFARDLDHKLISHTEDSAVFELSENEYTLKLFPYKFILRVEYKLKNDGVVFRSTVTNTDSVPFKFSLGSHSAFVIDNVNDFQIEFEKKEPLVQVACYKNGFLASTSKGDCPVKKLYSEKNPGIIPVGISGFGNGHLFTDIKSDWAGLRNTRTGELIRVNTKDYPCVMIWQNPGAPEFVCIEPWFGLPDADSTDHLWEHKPGLEILEPKKTFISDQSITVDLLN